MRLLTILLILPLAAAAEESALRLVPGWQTTRTFDSPFATQAAAADEKFFYAISNTVVAQYDRTTGQLVTQGTAPDAKHLNSGFVWQGRVYCAHSNYPQLPEESEIRVFDPQTGQLSLFQRFEDPAGSIVWCLKRGKHWWCCFAHYGEHNRRTVLIRYADGWVETGRWTFPEQVIADWDGMSASGGVFDGETLLVSHHHFRVLYRLRIPEQAGVLEFVEALSCPFPGQGIAVDPVTGGLIGIDRPRRLIVLAEQFHAPEAAEK